jgi:ABC-type branched-subunit amino acid transport system ATPase component
MNVPGPSTRIFEVGRPGSGVTILGERRQERHTVEDRSGIVSPAWEAYTFDESGWRGAPDACSSSLRLSHSADRKNVFPEMSVQKKTELGAYGTRGRSTWLKRPKERCVRNSFPVEGKNEEHWAQCPAGTNRCCYRRALMSKRGLLMLGVPSLGLQPGGRHEHLGYLSLKSRAGTAIAPGRTECGRIPQKKS